MTQSAEPTMLPAFTDYPLFNERDELFGEIPSDSIDERLSAIVGLMAGSDGENSARETLLAAATLAADAQSDAFYEVVGSAFETGAMLRTTDDAHGQLKDFFQRCARYGESRMLARIIATLFNAVETAGAPPVDKRN